MITVQVRGMEKVQNIFRNLPKNMEKEIMKKSDEFMKFVQKSAKLRAPKMTGELAQSIKVTKGKKNVTLIVESPYGIYQEYGFEPHWVHALLPTRNALGTIGNAYNIAGFMFVSKHTPFITPALGKGLFRLPTMLKNGARNAIDKSRR